MTEQETILQNEFDTLWNEYLKVTERVEEIKKRCNEIMSILDPDIFDLSTEEMKEISKELDKEIKLKKFANSLR